MLFSSPLLTVLTVLTATGIQTVSAHTRLYAVSINGVDQGIGCDELEGDKNKEYIRCPPNTDPVKDWGSKDMACNADGEKEADRWLPVKWGDKITFQWGYRKRSKDKSDDMIIDKSHKGPVLVYASPAPDGINQKQSWLKLFHSAGEGKTWAVEQLIEKKGLHWIEIPQLPPGKYFLRPELIALHNGYSKPSRPSNPQPYMSCVQVEVKEETGKGEALKANAETCAFPGGYPTDTSKWKAVGLDFDIYTDEKTAVERYSKIMPGPKLAVNNVKGGFGEAPSKRRRKA
ncbi:hypothetical protein EX30DRAFT_365629 [Ascodesmis nigricans]|uniref:AA9 family lytic polysaccharide monooxygenase n=1 Tax=Ascodesmis nigricans TaxID=341454 RepID=A0A4S2MP36_9PEZI|nr:hypothetical protein EX30DRAFT_365629 [Ascodesmis nigricans]